MGGAGGITINLSGDFYTSTEVAEEFGNELARIIKNQINLGGIRA
jgi:SAM-dependent MidA family methyltransferase